MTPRIRFMACAALIGFLGCTLGTAGLLATACPSHSCDPCPIVFCQSVAANASPKVDVAVAPPPASFHLVRLVRASAPAVASKQIPPFLSHEFRRPMRN
jgi:hypothetical protein